MCALHVRVSSMLTVATRVHPLSTQGVLTLFMLIPYTPLPLPFL